MTLKKSGLNDFDKIFVTVALWISAVTVFVTALTLPMLPDRVSIFYRPSDGAADDSYSKYNNLFLIIASVIPATIVLISAFLKKRNRLNNNFLSIVLFSIMLSICISCIIVFGIEQQFDASFSVKEVEIHGVISMFITFIMSITCSLMPISLRGVIPDSGSPDRKAPLRLRMASTAVEYWNIGAYGYLLIGIACTFTPALYCYIPLGVGFAAHLLFLILKK